MNPLFIVAPLLVVFLAIILTTNNYSALEYIMLLFFVAVIAIIGTNYFFGIQLTTTLSDLFNKPSVNIDIVEPESDTDEPQPQTDTEPDKKVSFYPQTYHIKGRFNYNTAKSVCKAYGAKLATLENIKNAYNRGGEWCDYGWSDDQMVLYPTQESSWKKYQETDHKEQCGIPGVNGGYNMNPNQKLGANCFGKKPDGVVPEVPVQPAKVDAQAAYWQQQNLTISPFNYTSWNAL